MSQASGTNSARKVSRNDTQSRPRSPVQASVQMSSEHSSVFIFMNRWEVRGRRHLAGWSSGPVLLCGPETQLGPRPPAKLEPLTHCFLCPAASLGHSQALSSGLTWQTVGLFLSRGGGMLKTQQSKSLRTAYVSKPFVLMGSAHSFLPCGSVFYLTLTSCAMSFPWLGAWLWRSNSQRKFLDSGRESKSSLSPLKDPFNLGLSTLCRY